MIGPILGGMARQRYSGATVNIIFDGNSLVAGGALPSPSTQNVAAQMALLAPLNGDVTVTNVGVNGQTIANMRTRGAAYVDANYVDGKRNILFAWEGTNAIDLGQTGAQAAAEMVLYCQERVAAHPDVAIILMTTLPRYDAYGGPWSVDELNVHLETYDAYLRANWRAMGARGLVDVRAGGIFIRTGSSMASVMAPYMIENIHYNAAGGAILAGYCVDQGLKRLPAR